MSITIDLEIEVSSIVNAKKIVQAVEVDVKSASNYFERSELRIFSLNNKIMLKIIAKDIVAAKSSINTTLIWLENAIMVIEKYSKTL